MGTSKKTKKEIPSKLNSDLPRETKSAGSRSGSSSAPARKSGASAKDEGRRSAGKAAASPAVRTEPESSRLIHQFIPYILIVAMLFLIACFVFAKVEGAVGIVGKTLRNFLCGLFGFTAFFTPLILLNLAIYWRKYVDMHMVAWKLCLSLITLTFTAALFHIFAIRSLYGNAYDWSVYGASIFNFASETSNWYLGTETTGGGFLGGLLGGLFRCSFGFIGSLILLIASIVVCVMFLFSVTPGYVWNSARAKMISWREKNAARREEIAREEERLRNEAETARIRAEKEQASRRSGTGTNPEAVQTAPSAAADVPFVTGVVENSRSRGWSPAEAGFQAGGTGTGTEAKAPGNQSGSKEPAPGIPVVRAPEAKTPPEPKSVIGSAAARPADTSAAYDEKDSVKMLDDVLGGISAAAPAGTDEPSKIRRKAERVSSAAAATDAPATRRSRDEEIISSMKQVVGEPETSDAGTVSSVSDAEKVGADRLRTYFFPPVSLLNEIKAPSQEDIAAELRGNAQRIMDKLAAFNVGIKKIEYSRGPTITRYELYPEANTRVRSIAGLADDIALELAATIRMEAPIPNKNAVGVEVPNQVRALVSIRELIESEKFKSMNSVLAACLGKDVGGNMVFFDVGKMPHLLIAGTTGSGKSVCLNTIIISLLYKARPDEVQFIMIDPKKIEMGMYNNLPHMKVPVVTDMKRAAGTLNAAVNEMEHRYELFEDCNARDLDGYNRLMTEGDPGFVPLPRIVIIIDELADLMMSAPTEIENSIIRLAQKARAAGIHLIIGTQRPSVNVITGLIKANVPSRIAFSVVSNVESRIIIDIAGAEKLIGKGDMLFSPIGSPKPSRIQGCFVSDEEVRAVTDFIKSNCSAVSYDDEFISDIDRETDRLAAQENHGKGSDDGDPAEFVQDADPLFSQALKVAVESGTVATSSLQRKLSIGFGRAAKIIDRMEALGFVSAANGTKPRNVLITKQQYSELEMAGDCRIQGRFN